MSLLLPRRRDGERRVTPQDRSGAGVGSGTLSAGGDLSPCCSPCIKVGSVDCTHGEAALTYRFKDPLFGEVILLHYDGCVWYSDALEKDANGDSEPETFYFRLAVAGLDAGEVTLTLEEGEPPE